MNTVHYSATIPVSVSTEGDTSTLSLKKVDLVPSSPLVEERLRAKRIERAATLEAFRIEVWAAKIEWEAELLLALEEFQETGGFVELKEEIKKDIALKREQVRLEEQRSRNRGRMSEPPLNSVIPSPSIVRGRDDAANKLRSEIFLPDVLDIQQAASLLLYKHNNVPLFRVGDPTLLTERADFRIQFLSSVMQQLYKHVNAQFVVVLQEDRPLLEEQRQIQEKLRMAQQRHMKTSMRYPIDQEFPMPVRR